ncbi:UNVERIFIED_CONTAM: serine carboxypeptidase CPVL [Trichonephila clavipes]
MLVIFVTIVRQPLILTPYIENGQIEEARSLSKVGRLPRVQRNIPSYSGFFTVNKTYDSNMFYWFFPAMNNDKEAPVILWLEGGPAVSSLYSLFVLHGPYIILQDISARLRQFTWVKEYNVIYVDNPVGAGFSYTGSDDGYVINQEEATDNLYEFLKQFFQVYYEYSKNDFYVVGESLGGKFVTSIAYRILKTGPPAEITLKGVGIGNGLVDPITQMNYSDYFYQLGLVDRKQERVIKNITDQIIQNIENENFVEARLLFNDIFGDIQGRPSPYYLQQFSGYTYPYFLLDAKAPNDVTYFPNYVQLPKFRKAVHVGGLNFDSGEKARNYLLEDFMHSVKPQLIEVMNNYNVLFYNGQLDLIVPYTLTGDLLENIEWKGSQAYKEADRKVWKLKDKDDIAGYVHDVGDYFFRALVRSSGHMVAHEQPEYFLDLINRFIKGIPYD